MNQGVVEHHNLNDVSAAGATNTDAPAVIKVCDLQDPEVMGDHVRLQNVLAEMAKAQKIVDAWYVRWAELELEQG